MWLWVNRIGYLLPIALQRLRSNLALALAALLALSTTVALAVSVPIYADAASLRLLGETLDRQEARTGRPAFALLVRYLSSWAGELTWQTLAAAEAQLQADATFAKLGLPINGITSHGRTTPLQVARAAGETPIMTMALGWLDLPSSHMRVVEGRLPNTTDSTTPEVIISRALAERVGLNVGDPLVLSAVAKGKAYRIEVRVSGVWQALNPHDPEWVYQPEAFDEVLLMQQASFAYLAQGEAAPVLGIAQVVWQIRYDSRNLTAANAAPLSERVERLRITVEALLPGVRVEQSPAAALGSYRSESQALSLRLLLIGAPTLALVLLFTVLIAGQLVERRSAEIALYKTRGVGDGQILGLFVIEWLLLAFGALLLGIPAGMALASVIARTSEFLRLDATLPALRLSITAEQLLPAPIALLIALIASLAPAAMASRRTLTDIQREMARPRNPLWERFYGDLLLLPIAFYSLQNINRSENAGGSDPLLLLAPSLLSLSLGLLALRLIPHLMAWGATLAARPAWIAPLLALRNLARRPAGSRGSLILLILTISMAMLSAAIASTSANELRQAVAYRVGAATQLIETGESTERQGGQQGQPARRDIRNEPRFLFVPASEHLHVAGIRAASRVGRYSARLNSSNVQLIGIERLTLPSVLRTYERAWSGGTPLTELMNRLARTADGVLISRELLTAGQRIGDRITLHAEIAGDRRDLSVTIVGVVDLFPGFYPQEGALVITNLDAIFDQMGGQYPYDVWIDRDPTVPLEDIIAGVRALGIDLIDVRDAAEILRSEQSAPQRQGFFGLLSIGFLTATTLTILGCIISSALGARRQAVELGVLRALGLSARSVASALILEQAIIAGIGIGVGVGIGVLNTILVVPQLQLGSGSFPGTPPIAAQIAWGELGTTVSVVSGSLLIALSLLGFSLTRMHLFRAIKMGDSN